MTASASRFRTSRWALAAFASVMIVGCTETPEERIARIWPERCQEIKKVLGDSPSMNVRYSAPPAAPVTIPVWRLRWAGLSVPVPVADYRKLVIQRGEGPQPSTSDMVLLVDEAGRVVSLGFAGGFAPSVDAFGKVDLATGEVSDAADGAYLTELLWGRPVSLGEMLRRAYEVTPADLSCQGDAWRREMADSYSLVLKGVASPAPVTAAFRLPEDAWMTREEDEKKVIWRAFFPREDVRDLAAQVELHIPAGAPDVDAGLLIGTPAAADTTPPPWLTALQLALAGGQRAEWESLANLLPEAGFDGASQARLAEFIRQRFDDPLSSPPAHPPAAASEAPAAAGSPGVEHPSR